MAESGRRGGLEGLVAGSIVIALFPYSDGTGLKRRPALVLRTFEHDLILLQITTQYMKSDFEIPIIERDFIAGNLSRACVIRPDIVFTCDREMVSYEAARLCPEKTQTVVDTFCAMIRSHAT